MDPNWKENIDQILLMYENSIDDEVKQTLSAFESLSPPMSQTFVSCFFDVLRNRMNETLRKVQLAYLVKLENACADTDNSTDDPFSDVLLVSVTNSTLSEKNDAPTEKVDEETSKVTKDTAKAAEVIFTIPAPPIEPSIDAAISQILNDTDEIDSYHEANETTTVECPTVAANLEPTVTAASTITANAMLFASSPKKLQEQNDEVQQDISFSEVFSDTETISEDQNECSQDESPKNGMDEMEISAPGSPNRSQTQVNPLKRKEDDPVQPTDDLSKKPRISDETSPPASAVEVTELNSFRNNPLQKRSPPANVDAAENASHYQLVPIPKNNDPNIYWHNSIHQFKCILCAKTDNSIATHYRLEHPDRDVYISRPTPGMIQRILQRSEPSISKAGLISSLCIFCEETKNMSGEEWKHHTLWHTGELEFYCTECSSQLAEKKAHGDCSVDSIVNVCDDANGSGELKVFLCRRCNYVQLSKPRMVRHLEHEHDAIDSNFNRNIERITVLPDLRALTWELNAGQKFVNEQDRFRCSIGSCGGEFSRSGDFRSHFTQYHNNETTFICPHCNVKIKKLHRHLETDILNHFQLHGNYLNECVTCGEQCGNEYEILQHIARCHPNESMMYRLSIILPRGAIEKKEFTIWLQCIVCSARFESGSKASDHFIKAHKSFYIDFLAVKMVKRTTADGVTSCITPTERRVFAFRRSLVCKICDRMPRTMSSLIDHFNLDHPTQEISVRLGKMNCVDTSRDPGYADQLAHNFNNYMVFYCVKCRDTPQETALAFLSVNDVHAHWTLTHSMPPESVPFQFYAIEFVSCYHCKHIGSFQEIQRHQKEVHPNEPVVISNLLDHKKCALCAYTGNELASHFKSEHELVLRMNTFNPTHFTEDTLNKLLAINVNKKFKCGYCDAVFGTKDNVENHISSQHSQPIKYNSFLNSHDVKIVAGCCQKVIHLHQFLDHLADPNHQFPSSCTKCNFDTNELLEFVEHQAKAHQMVKDADGLYRRVMQTRFWATKVIFWTGLTASKHNLLGTEFDDSKPFENLVEQLLTVAREKLIANSNQF